MNYNETRLLEELKKAKGQVVDEDDLHLLLFGRLGSNEFLKATVNNLQNEGYNIEYIGGKGYKLIEESEVATEEKEEKKKKK